MQQPAQHATLWAILARLQPACDAVDVCLGLLESVAEFYPETHWQRCVVHWYRNAFSYVPTTKLREVSLMLKAIHAVRRPRPGPARSPPSSRP